MKSMGQSASGHKHDALPTCNTWTQLTFVAVNITFDIVFLYPWKLMHWIYSSHMNADSEPDELEKKKRNDVEKISLIKPGSILKSGCQFELGLAPDKTQLGALFRWLELRSIKQTTTGWIKEAKNMENRHGPELKIQHPNPSKIWMAIFSLLQLSFFDRPHGQKRATSSSKQSNAFHSMNNTGWLARIS